MKNLPFLQMVENTQKAKQNKTKQAHLLITLLPSVLNVKMCYTFGSRDSHKDVEFPELLYSESMITLV